MGDILVHDYDGVNIGIVTDELPRNRAPFGTATAAIQGLKCYECPKMKENQRIEAYRLFVANYVISKRLTPKGLCPTGVRKPAALAGFRIAAQALYRLRARPVTAVPAELTLWNRGWPLRRLPLTFAR
jgi:hypothetical protein